MHSMAQMFCFAGLIIYKWQDPAATSQNKRTLLQLQMKLLKLENVRQASPTVEPKKEQVQPTADLQKPMPHHYHDVMAKEASEPITYSKKASYGLEKAIRFSLPLKREKPNGLNLLVH